MIKVENLKKIYITGEVKTKALDGVSFEIEDGSFFVITGKSGSGKSTLLHLMSLLDNPTEGKVLIDDNDMSEFSDKEIERFRLEKLGYVFQDYALLPELTATENVILPLLVQGVPKNKAIEKAHNVLSRVGLGDRLNNRPSQLSGGQQQRVGIARAITHGPILIFADEPTSSLDSETSKEVMDYLLELNKEEGITLVLVTHEESYIERADRNIMLKDGKIKED
ncbi:MAG: ABC transporter, partial [Parcubacteria group bacterium QH_9_35_7]